MNISLKNTLGNEHWLRQNEGSLRSLFPDTWTLVDQQMALRLAFKFKLLGIDWRSTDEFGCIMAYLETIGVIFRRNGYQIRANHRSIFEQSTSPK